MKIKKLHIKSFGKLNDLEVELNPGLNVIYGSNEAGKSTTQHFIKSMFYGMSSLKKNIRENDRRRFLPWDARRAEGTLVFQDDYENEYIIHRSFGQTKKEDDSIVYNTITGQKALHIDNNQPGRDIFGFGEDAFEKTLFIKQLGAKVAMDKEDEIMKKLTNLNESGEEDISYNKAKAALDNFKKILRGSRKNGKIDQLEESIIKYRELKRELKNLQIENLEDSEKLKAIEDKIKRLEQELDLCYVEKNSVKADSILSEAEKDFKESCYAGELKEGELLLQKGEQCLSVLKERIETLEAMEKDSNNLKTLVQEEKVKLKLYEGISNLGEDIEIKLNSIAIEKREREEKLQNIGSLKADIRKLEEEIINLSNKAGVQNRLLSITADQENELLDLQERAKELSYLIEAEKLKDNRELKLDILKDKKKNSIFLMTLGVIFTLAIFWGISAENTFGVLIGVMGALLLAYGFVQFSAASNRLRDMQVLDTKGNNLDLLLKEKREVEEKLSELFIIYGVNSYSELKTKLDNCRNIISTIEGIKRTVDFKKKELSALNEEEVEYDLSRINKYYDFLYDHCKCSTLEEFYKKLKEYKTIKADFEKLKEQYDRRIDENFTKRQQHDFVKEELKDLLLNFIGINIEDAFGVQDYETALKAIRSNFERMREIQQKAYSGYNEKRELLEVRSDNLHKELIQCREYKKDVEHKIELRFKDREPLWVIEEELERFYSEKASSEKLFSSAEIADEVLTEAFEEMQKNFAPKLNAEVGEILNKITEGKYREVKVSANYEINVMENQRPRELEYLSGGTFDQVYFALRLGLCNIIFQKEAVPIFLDDAFIQYDEERLNNVIEFLKEYSNEHQVIVFTCRKLPSVSCINLDELSQTS